MANPAWPGTLPQDPYKDGTPSYEPADNTIRTSVDIGPAKQRRRFTAAVETVTLSMILSDTELAALRTFVKTTLKEVLPFDWQDFRTGDPATYRFPKGWASVKHEWYGGDLWAVSLELEQQP